MKYGKQYLDTLEHVPEEWRQQAIEYRKLKKVINRVANELKDLGLTSEVLKELLNQQSPQKKKDAEPVHQKATEEKGSTLRWADEPGTSAAKDEDAKEEADASIQEVIDEAEGVVETEEELPEAGRVPLDAKGKGKAKATRKRRVRATYELGGTAANPEPRIHLVFSSCSSSSYSESESSDPVRNDSGDDDDSSPANFLFKRHARKRSRSMNSNKTPKAQIVELPSSEGEGPETDPDGTGDFPEAAHSEAARLAQADTAPTTPEDSGSARAEGDETPQTESTGSVADGVNTDDDVEFEGAGPQANGLLRRMYGFGKRWSEDEESPAIYELDENGERVPQTPPSEEEEDAADGSRPLRRQLSQETIKSSLAGMSLRDGPLGKVEKGEQDRKKADRAEKVKRKVEEADQADDEGDTQPAKPANGTTHRRKHRPRQHRREVYIPLNSDTEFLTLLASALNSLATLQHAQKRQFTEAVQILAREVSSVSSPSRPKTDLYIWREIFSLWVEAAIFESSRERDRGERSIEEVEKRLEWFVDQVAKRKLAKRMRNKESRVALEKFVALNVELLDLKKFQVANEEAARKILKKHDKRTALTASLGFPKFIADGDASKLISTELIHSGDDGKARPVLTLPGFPSLPHILLSTFTSTLLPIIPQLEDYECSICGDVAFKPIRLACGHKFCVRCLVKMQKRGQDNCPQCRKAVVLRANATNLDQELQQFLLRWFPHEVKEKERSNHKESAREELEEMGLKEHKCRMM